MKKIFLTGFLLAAGAFLYGIDPGSSSLYPRCLLKVLTGWNCAACGLQRAGHAFLHGRWMEALSYNLFLPVLLLAFLLVFLAEALPEKRMRQRLRCLIYNRVALVGFAALAVSWTLLRNVLGI